MKSNSDIVGQILVPVKCRERCIRGSIITLRRTIVVHTKLSGHMIRVDAARSGANGVQVMTIGRLAGGFLQPIDPENLQEAVRTALAGSSLGEFDAIKDLPGHGDRRDITRARERPASHGRICNSLLYTQYQDRQAFAILALLGPNLDYKNKFHKDHLHPKTAFDSKALTAAGVPVSDMEFYRGPERWNSILNLGHLDANENQSKSGSTLADWASKEARRQKVSIAKLCSDDNLPDDPSLLDFMRFRDFIVERRRILGKLLRQLL